MQGSFVWKSRSDSVPATSFLRETPQRQGAMGFQSCPWDERDFNSRRNPSRNIFANLQELPSREPRPSNNFDLLELPSREAGPSDRFKRRPTEMNWYPIFSKLTPEIQSNSQLEVPQAPRKTGYKKLDRSRLQPKKLSYTAEESAAPFVPITDTYNSLYYRVDDQYLGGSNSSKSVRVFHENSNHQNGTPNRSLAGEQARSAKDFASVVPRGTHGQVRSSNKENDSPVSIRVRRSSTAKRNNVTHVDSSIALKPKVVVSPRTPLGSSWEKVIEWLQPQRDTGLWVECCNKSCKKWRYVEEYHDPCKVPKDWYCWMQQNDALASCDTPETTITAQVASELIENKYNAGSIVLAYMYKFPWWPAIVCDSPDTLTFYKLRSKSTKPFEYFVVFLNKDKFEYAWIKTRSLKSIPYTEGPKKLTKKFQQLYGERLNESYELAKEAENLTILERLKKFDYLAWHKRCSNIGERESCTPRQTSTKDQPCEIDFDSIDIIPPSPTAATIKRRKCHWGN